jgi:hypothetical protein
MVSQFDFDIRIGMREAVGTTALCVAFVGGGGATPFFQGGWHVVSPVFARFLERVSKIDSDGASAPGSNWCMTEIPGQFSCRFSIPSLGFMNPLQTT